MSSRKSLRELTELNQKVIDNPVLKTILEYAPVFVGVLTEERQFVLVNEQFFSNIGFEAATDGMGMRTGEVFGCIHHHDVPSGCGDGPACRYCSIFSLLSSAMESGESREGEVRLSSEKDGVLQGWDLMMNIEPVVVDGYRFFIIFMQDISGEKRKVMMERIFFHDILNSAASLSSLVSLLYPDPEEVDPDGFVGLLRNRIDDVVEQIRYQKQLLAAEKGDIVLNLELIDIRAELEDLAASERQTCRLNGLGVEIALEGTAPPVHSDRVLLRRTLMNMMKNAREASSKGDTVSIVLEAGDAGVRVRVHNPAVMLPAVQAQLFQRSFSTKGAGRGLGTYSMKLLTTRYLDSHVTFRSEEGFGTEFILTVPASLTRDD